jgi:hypothetical protein
MADARADHTATLLSDGRVLIAGGTGRNSQAQATTEIFDPKQDSFTSGPTMLASRSGQTAVLVGDGEVWLAGGASLESPTFSELCGATTGICNQSASIDAARTYYTATQLKDGRVLICGGYTLGSTNIANAGLYDPNIPLFTPTGSMSQARSHHAAVLLADGRVLVLGGGDDGYTVALDSAEIYQP